jgi:signal transduction histidine kinase
MQPQWFSATGSAAQTARQDNDQPTGQPAGSANGQPDGQFGVPSGGLVTPAQAAIQELTARAETLLKRLREVEDALTDQEWWLMGRAMAEARVLAEMTSLLSVARGELETFLAEVGGQSNDAESAARRKEQDDVFDLMGDPMWMSGSREKAIALLRMCAAQIQPMRQYANVLQANAEKLRLPAVAIDPLSIASERLAEAAELLRQPPV